MTALRLVAVAFVLAGLSACGGGGTSPATTVLSPVVAPVGNSSGPGSVASSPKQAATFTVTIPRAATASGSSSSARSVQYISPSTTFFYIDLQDSPGHGDPAFSYTENVDSTHCNAQTEQYVCTFTEMEPVGTNLYSILAASGGANTAPLSYAGVLNSANTNGGPISATITAAGPNAVRADLAPIAATAPGSYQFISLGVNGPGQSFPYFTLVADDAGGNVITFAGSGFEANPDFVNPITINYGSPFTAEVVQYMPYGGYSIPLGTSYVYAANMNFYVILNGFSGTTTFTITVPPVVVSETEFPQMALSTLSTPGSVESYVVSCTPNTEPTVNPCTVGTAPASFTISSKQR